MSIQSVSGASYPSAAQFSNWKNAFDQLTNAIQSGDLNAAQQAYASLKQQLQNTGAGSGAGQGNGFAQGLSQVGTALQAGNLNEAQQALSSLQQRPHAHHQHRSHGSSEPANNSGSAANASSDANANAAVPPSATGSSVDITA